MLSAAAFDAVNSFSASGQFRASAAAAPFRWCCWGSATAAAEGAAFVCALAARVVRTPGSVRATATTVHRHGRARRGRRSERSAGIPRKTAHGVIEFARFDELVAFALPANRLADARCAAQAREEKILARP